MKYIINTTQSGTSHFVSVGAAIAYYGCSDTVSQKINEGAISIGKPEPREGYTLLLLEDERRYVWKNYTEERVFSAFALAACFLDDSPMPDFTSRIHKSIGLSVVRRGQLHTLIDHANEILATYAKAEGVHALKSASKGEYFNVMSHVWGILADNELRAKL